MKKHARRIVAIVCLLAMMSALAACTQTIEIAFVDKNGQVYNPFENVGTGSVNVYNSGTGSASSGSSSAAPATTAAPAAAADTTAAPAASADTTAAPANTDAAAPAGAPTGTEAIANFYKTAIDRVKNAGEAGYTKKEWQSISDINIGASVVNSAVSSLAGSFMTVEEKAENQVNAKGSEEALNRFPNFTLTDYSKIASAECTTNASGNYQITMVFVDEDTPKKDGNMLGQITNSVMYWEDIEKTLKEDSTVTAVLKSYSDIHVLYKGFKISAEITPDGKFVSMEHLANVSITIGSAKILMFTVENKSATLVNTCKYSEFQY